MDEAGEMRRKSLNLKLRHDGLPSKGPDLEMTGNYHFTEMPLWVLYTGDGFVGLMGQREVALVLPHVVVYFRQNSITRPDLVRFHYSATSSQGRLGRRNHSGAP
jgi:hypothetical protein